MRRLQLNNRSGCKQARVQGMAQPCILCSLPPPGRRRTCRCRAPSWRRASSTCPCGRERATDPAPPPALASCTHEAHACAALASCAPLACNLFCYCALYPVPTLLFLPMIPWMSCEHSMAGLPPIKHVWAAACFSGLTSSRRRWEAGGTPAARVPLSAYIAQGASQTLVFSRQAASWRFREQPAPAGQPCLQAGGARAVRQPTSVAGW